MALSQDIKSQFAKTIIPKREPTESTVNGTFKVINGKEYVQLDGSDILTPVKSTVVADTGDRVKVLLKEHSATVNGNITSPSARSKDLSTIKDTVDEFGNTIQMMDNSIQMQNTSIIALETNVNQHEVTINQHQTSITQQGDTIVSLQNDILLQNNQISAISNDINLQGNKIDQMNDTIESHGNNITQMNNDITTINNKVQSYDNTIEQMGNRIIEFNNTIESQNNQITQMDNNISQANDTIQSQGNTIVSMGNDILILNSGFKIVNGQLTGLSEAIIDVLKTQSLNAEYAKIDFANIGEAAIEKLFTDSGIIKDLIMDDGYVTGELVGVVIKGDLIEANTLKADRLLILGPDGLYHRLNAEGEFEEAEQNDSNSLNGQVIVAKSITASKMNVEDLVAFGATIGKFVINDNSIHSIAKGDPHGTNPGIYLGSDGQFGVGDGDNFVKFYQDANHNWQLDIKAKNIRYGNDGISVEVGMNNMSTTIRETGGSNLLRNSVGYSGIDFWTKTGTGIISTNQNESMSFSGSEFILTGPISLSQIYNTEIGNKYSVSCKLKHTAVGSAGTAKIVIKGDGGDKVVYQSSATDTEWRSVKMDPYDATSNNAEIVISIDDNDKLEITDLIISNGDTIVWSGYFDEVYSKGHLLDKNGLRFMDHQSNKNSLLNSSSLNFYENGNNNNPVATLSKSLMKTNATQITSSHTIGKLRTVVLDDNNLIEYI